MIKNSTASAKGYNQKDHLICAFSFRIGIIYIILPIRNYVKTFWLYNFSIKIYNQVVMDLKLRKRAYGDVNIVGMRVEQLRKERGISQKDFIAKMQTMGCDINPTSYSKLEGQIRIATDKEIFAIAKILNLPVDALFPEER